MERGEKTLLARFGMRVTLDIKMALGNCYICDKTLLQTLFFVCFGGNMNTNFQISYLSHNLQ